MHVVINVDSGAISRYQSVSDVMKHDSSRPNAVNDPLRAIRARRRMLRQLERLTGADIATEDAASDASVDAISSATLITGR
jgi:hypothetical protein